MSKLNRQLTLSGLTMIAIGSCIGSGIFITPADSLAKLPHHGWVLLVWALGGVVAYLGALTFSELGSRFPGAGGVYVYIKEAYGPLMAFLYGWIILLIVNTGALAALAYALADYLNFFFPLEGAVKSVVAILIIVILTFVNVLGVKTSQMLATLFTTLKLLAIAFIIIIGLVYASTTDHTIIVNPMVDIPDGLFSGILLAFVGVFWSTGGWHHATYMAGETIDPQRNVPRAMKYGTITVTVTYLLVILSFMLLVPMQEMAQSERIAGDALQAVFTWGGRIVSIMISISIFGTIAIYTMSAPRIYYAMAEDGLFFKFLSKTHPTFKTPHYAMILQSSWAIILILLWGSFIRIITFVTFMDILFMAIAASTLFVIRRSQEEQAPFHLKYYPVVPILYLLVTVAVVLNTAINLQSESFAGTIILIIGLPVFYFFKRSKKK